MSETVMPSMTGTIEIRTAKWKLYLILFLVIAIPVVIALFVIEYSEMFPSWIMAILITIAIWFIIPAANNLTRQIPLIVISDEGLFVKGQRFKIMPWEQIAEVKLVRFGYYWHDLGQSMKINKIVIIPRDPKFGAIPEDGFISSVARAAQTMNKNRIFISVFGLEKRPKEIYELIRQRAGLPIEPS